MQRVLPLLLVLGACSDPELEMRVAQLETEVKQMKEQGVKPAAPAAVANPAAARAANAQQAPGPAGGPDDARKQAAIDLFKAGNAMISSGDYEGAKAKFNEVITSYGDTPAANSARKAMAEIEIIGQPSVPLQVEKWYQGETKEDPNVATLYVFWEVWCPHCKREVPKLEATHKEWSGKGLKVVGLTKQTRNITDDQVTAFIAEKGVSYPVAKEADGAMSRAYNVSGIPAAAVVKGGKVLWRGHPGRVTPDMIKQWTGS